MALAIQYSPSLFERSYAARPWQALSPRRLPAARRVRSHVVPIQVPIRVSIPLGAHRAPRRAAIARVSGLPRLVRDALILALLVAPYLL